MAVTLSTKLMQVSSRIFIPLRCSGVNFSTSDALCIKRKNISKWKNSFPSQVYTEVDLKERSFDEILGTRMKSKLRRKRLFKALLDRLITKERVVVSFTKGKALARLTELLIDTAKNGDEPGVYYMMQRKELVPRVFEDLLPRFKDHDGKYTRVYHLHAESLPYKTGLQYKYHTQGSAVVELKGNCLPPLLPPRDELERRTLEQLMKKKELVDNSRCGTVL